MDLNSSSNQTDFLWSLLENPANDAGLYAYNLRRLVDEFPQSGVLQALLAHASEEKNLKRASAYFNPRALFKLVNAPSTFTGVPSDRIFIQPGISINGSHQPVQAQGDNSTGDAENYTGEALVADKGAPVAEVPAYQQPDELVADPGAEAYLNRFHTEHISEHTATDEPAVPEVEDQVNGAAGQTIHSDATPPWQDQVEEQIAEMVAGRETAAEENNIPAEDNISGSAVGEDAQPEVEPAHIESVPVGGIPEPVHNASGNDEAPIPVNEQPEEKTPEIEPSRVEDTYIDTVFEPVQTIELPENRAVEPAAEIPLKEELPAQPEITATGDELEETYDEIVGIEDIKIDQHSTVSFFTFDQEFGAHDDESPEKDAGRDVNEENAPAAQDVSPYHDEKMPYTFLWWLDKTRKEHAATYQPYTKPPANPSKKNRKLVDTLQQQYIENIFHITSVDELDRSTTAPPMTPDLKKKEQEIIDRFIIDEPQIKPQSSDKLDNENKARKSSEDRDELVTETLAVIYTDQMLYHKAIASYKKLMLKFPEKSRYFADKIEQLEKKTN